MTNERLDEQQNIHVDPTVFLTMTVDGDVQFSTNDPNMDISTVTFMMDIAKTKMLNTYVASLALERKKREATGVIVPKIARA